MKENSKPPVNPNDGQDPNPFKIFGAKLRSRPLTGIVPSYDDQNIDNNAQSQQSYYQSASREPFGVQTRSETSTYGSRTFQQPSSSSFTSSRPDFSKTYQ